MQPSVELPVSHPARRRVAFALAIALGLLALEWRPLAPRPVPRPIVAFSPQAAADHYRRHEVHDLATLLAKYDRSRDALLDANEVRAGSGHYAGFSADLAGLLDPSELLLVLDALTPNAARGLLAERAGAALDGLASADPREAYWHLDTASQYLSRRTGALSARARALVDGGGTRRIHGGEDLPPVMAWSDERVRAYSVPWPSGNVAVASVGGCTRAFLTPFPDANFGDAQVYELDLESGALRPYPAKPELQRELRTSLGIEAHDGVLYVVDHGGYGLRDARLVAIDLGTDRVLLDHAFASSPGQMPNDLAFVDEADHTRVFISDTAPGRDLLGWWSAKSGIIEIDLHRGEWGLGVVGQKRWLDGDPIVEDGGFSLYPDRDRPARTWLGAQGWGGVDGIAARGRELYFRRMQQPEIEVVSTAGPIDAAHAHVLDRFPFIDGFHIDDRELLWFGDVEGGSLFVYDLRTRAMVKVLQDRRFQWLDEVNVLGDRAYVTTSHLHEYMNEVAPWRRRRAVAAAAPFAFYVVDVRPALATIERLRAELSP